MHVITRIVRKLFWSKERNGKSVEIVTLLPNEGDWCGQTGAVALIFSKRLTREAMGDRRTIQTIGKSWREGRSIKTQINLGPESALMLRQALDEALKEAGIIEIPENKSA